jgi:hypothetical protein
MHMPTTHLAAILLSGVSCPALLSFQNNAGFVPYSGEGFALLLPSKWNPSKEQDFPGVVLR